MYDECGKECEMCDIVSMLIVSCVYEYLNETTSWEKQSTDEFFFVVARESRYVSRYVSRHESFKEKESENKSTLNHWTKLQNLKSSSKTPLSFYLSSTYHFSILKLDCEVFDFSISRPSTWDRQYTILERGGQYTIRKSIGWRFRWKFLERRATHRKMAAVHSDDEVGIHFFN